MDIKQEIEGIFDRGELDYLLYKYVNRDYWTIKLYEIFSNTYYIDNVTDFNYNKCFSIYINLSDIKARAGEKEFDDYITENKNLYRASIEISALAPYCVLKYLRYYKREEIKCEVKDIPYCEEHIKFDREIRKFLFKNNITILDDDTLMIEIPGKSLELKEAPVSVYNCLFEDTYCYYPYLDKE